jgi:oligoendopeptidase F
MKIRLVCLALACSLSAAAETDADRWNLADIYPSAEAWSEARLRVDAELASIDGCKGRMAADARALRECLDLIYALRKEAARVFSYASMLSDQDTRVDEHAKMRGEAQLLFSKFSERTSFVRPEIIAAGRETIERFRAQEPGLTPYGHPLDEILREAPHTRSEEVERVIARIGPLAAAPQDFYRTLTNAEIPWPTVKLADGSEIRLDQSGYAQARQVSDRDDRLKVFQTFWAAMKAYERTLGTSLYGQLKRDNLMAELRGYPSSLASALSGDNIPEEVYRGLIRSANANLKTLHRYFRLRARMLGLDDAGYHDIYPPLIGEGKKFSKEEGVELALAAGRVLGDEYVQVMNRGFEERWIDWFPRQGKRSGAYMNGSVYDVHPYLLLNFDGTYSGVSTLAHEYGHAVHSFLANKTQPYPTARYSTFVAEVASIANEALLLDRMLKTAGSDDDRLFYLGHELEKIRGSFFRQTMFAEFELIVHDKVDAGEALTGADFTKIYGELLERYHGHGEGVLTIDPLYAVEWAYIPHFYLDFYVFQYATSNAAAALLAEAILADKPGAKQAYLDLLREGGSDYPIEQLKRAGVDMTTSAPYVALIVRAERVMDEIEAILDRRAPR